MSKNRKRKSKGHMRQVARSWNGTVRDVGATRVNENHERIHLDSLEFTLLFAVRGGLRPIGPGTIKTFDQNGRRAGIRFGEDANGKPLVGVAVVDPIAAVGKGPVARWSESWRDAEAILEARADALVRRVQRRATRLDSAVERDAIGWYRQDMPDAEMRSVLLGTNRGVSPANGSDGIVTTFRTEHGEYAIAREFWDGGWSAPDENGERQRKGVTRDLLPITFPRASDAQRAFFHAVDEGATLHFESGAKLDFGEIRSAHRMRDLARRLKLWERDGVDMKQVYDRPAPSSRVTGGKSVVIGANE